MRVYVPTTMAALEVDWASGTIPATDDVVVAEDDSEDEEYAALTTAADLSAALLSGRGRRVVVVAEVADPAFPIPLKRVVAVHVDSSEDHDEDDDLEWWAAQEVPHLLETGRTV